MNPIVSPFFQLNAVRQAVLLPAIVSILYLVRLWRRGELYGAKQFVFISWFIVSLLTEFVTQSTWIWIAALLAQVSLAIVLVLKYQIDSI
jgi:hypothetical protein